MTLTISQFRSSPPAHVRAQSGTLDWLCAAHVQSELTRAARDRCGLDEERVRSRLRAAVKRFGCGEDKIATRGYELDDCGHTRWEDMEVYRLHEAPSGVGISARTRAFERIAGAMLERMCEQTADPPSDLLHVTCTGYASPSPAQALVARRGWGATTRVTHVYHMGCYAAFPALRLACSAQSHSASGILGTTSSEIVHTELCSLHVNPANHEPEQLVIQSLFADGGVAYRVAGQTRDEMRSSGFELLALLERIIPDSDDAMSWRCSEWGMEMTLERDVPERLGAALMPFVAELRERARLPREAKDLTFFAVHPGGPRILDRVQDLLRLEELQIESSRKVLRERGNMSSATLPHIWMELAEDTRVPVGAEVMSLAFGPGLTICGAVLRKIAP